jgi:hypothetical protein
MRTRIIVALFAIAALVIVSVASGAARQRDVWEYSVQYEDSQGTLTKMGADGWEVAAAYTTADKSVRVIMKRRKG